MKFALDDIKKIIMNFNINQYFAKIITDYGKIRGVDFQFQYPNSGYIELDELCKKTEEIFPKFNDENLGFKLGSWANLNDGFFSELFSSSQNLISAINNLIMFSLTEFEPIKVKLKNQKGSLKLSYRPKKSWVSNFPISAKYYCEMILVMSKRYFEILLNDSKCVLEIGLMQNDSKNPQLLKILETTCSFNEKYNWLKLPTEVLDMPISKREQKHLEVIMPYANERASKIEENSGYSEKVKASIFRLLDPTFPNLEDVASNLGVSKRTLQRRLKEEGIKFKDIIEEIKAEIAENYLRDESLAIKEIAHLLNFSDPSTFVCSFKKQRNITPLQWRKNRASNF